MNDTKTQNYEDEFANLSDSQKKLLLYRKIVELVDSESWYDNEKETKLELDKLIEYADTSFLKPSLLYLHLMRYNYVGEKYRETYKKSLICLNTILKNYKKLAEELNLNSALELSHLFTYLLWNGYLSVNKNYTYQKKGRLFSPPMDAFNVINGQGLSLENASFLNDYLLECEKNTSILGCEKPLDKEKIKIDFKPDIEQKIRKNSKISQAFTETMYKLIFKAYGNHFITLIEENGQTYAYDPTNICALNIEDERTASIINGTGKYDLKYLISFFLDKNCDPNHIFEKILSGEIKQALTREDFVSSFEEIMDLVRKNKGLLDDSYDNIRNYLDFIKKQTNDFKVMEKTIRNSRKYK